MSPRQNPMAGGTGPIPGHFWLLEFWPRAASQEKFCARPDCGKRLLRRASRAQQCHALAFIWTAGKEQSVAQRRTLHGLVRPLIVARKPGPHPQICSALQQELCRRKTIIIELRHGMEDRRLPDRKSTR